MSDTDASDVEEAKAAYAAWLNDHTWTFAKTMAENPHEYIVRDWSSVNETMYNAFEDFIEREGYDEEFEGYTYRVMDIGNHKYWVMGKILNRKCHDGYDVLAELREMGVDPSEYVNVEEYEDEDQ